MSLDALILIGNLTKGILLVLTVVGTGMVLASLRKYQTQKTYRIGLLSPGFVYLVGSGVFFIDVWLINGITESMGEPYTFGVILALIFAVVQIYALAIILRSDIKSHRPPINDEVDVIAMLVDRSIEKDKTLRTTLMVMFGIISIVLAFLIYFGIVNFGRLFTLMEQNRELLEMLELKLL